MADAPDGEPRFKDGPAGEARFSAPAGIAWDTRRPEEKAAHLPNHFGQKQDRVTGAVRLKNVTAAPAGTGAPVVPEPAEAAASTDAPAGGA